MLYIGTSLSGCLNSIMKGEVSFDEVLFIATRTNCQTYEQYVSVVKRYCDATMSMHYVRNAVKSLGDWPVNDVLDLANSLWYNGKIHQPRNFIHGEANPFVHHYLTFGTDLWLHVAPLNTNSNPMVREAWEKYKMLDTLTKDE